MLSFISCSEELPGDESRGFPSAPQFPVQCLVAVETITSRAEATPARWRGVPCVRTLKHARFPSFPVWKWDRVLCIHWHVSSVLLMVPCQWVTQVRNRNRALVFSFFLLWRSPLSAL